MPAKTALADSPSPQPECHSPNTEKRGHATNDNQRPADVVLRVVCTQLQIGAQREATRPKQESGRQNRQREPFVAFVGGHSDWSPLRAAHEAKWYKGGRGLAQVSHGCLWFKMSVCIAAVKLRREPLP